MPDNPTPELLAALSKFQHSTLTAFKDKSAYSYRYATELSINKAIQPSKVDGLTHVFTCQGLRAGEPGIPGVTEVRLRLFHAASGGCLTSSMLVDDYDPTVGKLNKKGEFVVDPKNQQRGGGISYARRYLLTAMFGLACDENEGETDSPPAPVETVTKKFPPNPYTSTPKQGPDFAKARTKFADQIKAIFATDPGVYAQWSAELIDVFKNSPNPISAAKPTPDNLTCSAHFLFCDEFLARYNSTKAAVSTP
jgi:hypothetical protein